MNPFYAVCVMAAMMCATGCGSRKSGSTGEDKPGANGTVIEDSTKPTPNSGDSAVVSPFESVIKPKCAGCHSSASPAGGVSLASRADVLARLADVRRAVSTATMPPRSRDPLAADEKSRVLKWLDDGAPALSASTEDSSQNCTHHAIKHGAHDGPCDGHQHSGDHH